MTTVIEFFIALIKLLLPAIVDEVKTDAKDTVEDAAPQPELRDRLKARVRQAGWKAGMFLMATGLSGCGTSVVIVAPGEPVQIRETIRGAKVWVLDAHKVRQPSVCDIPAGWYALPDDEPTKTTVVTK